MGGGCISVSDLINGGVLNNWGGRHFLDNTDLPISQYLIHNTQIINGGVPNKWGGGLTDWVKTNNWGPPNYSALKSTAWEH